jgi:hypothetical protein
METKFNFKSQICTTREQSERLLSLGLKKETADMIYYQHWENAVHKKHDVDVLSEHNIPAWSLHRLIEMLPGLIYPKEELPSFSGYAYLNLTPIVVWYNYIDYDMEDRTLKSWRGNGLFSAVVDAIEWLIKEGYFNKEYLEE